MRLQQDGLGFLVADVTRLMRRAFQRRMEGTSVTPAQARALVYVSRHQGVRQVDLAEKLDVQPVTLGRMIDQLAAAGMVKRRRDPVDRRAYHVFLTPSAAPHLDTIARLVAAVEAQALRGLDKRQADIALSALRRFRDNLSVR